MRSQGSFGFFLKKALSLFLGQLLRFQNDNKFLECSGESKWHFVQVVLNHGCARVFADVKGFIEGEANRYGLAQKKRSVGGPPKKCEAIQSPGDCTIIA